MNTKARENFQRLIAAVQALPATLTSRADSVQSLTPRAPSRHAAARWREKGADAGGAILVLNAGSSSFKFTEFLLGEGEALEVGISGNLEDLALPGFAPGMRAARSSANMRGRAGAANTRWCPGVLVRLAAGARQRCEAGRGRSPGGARRHQVRPRQCASTRPRSTRSPSWCRWRRCTSRTTCCRSASSPSGGPGCRKVYFDTAFHQSASPLAQAFALPPSITDRGVRRYGFHGLSYESTSPQCCRARRACSGRQDRGAAPRQRRQHVRHERREERCDHDGLHRGRRRADGHAVRHSRSRRGPLPDAGVKDGPNRDRVPSLPGVGSPWVSGVSTMRALAQADPRAKFAIDLFVYRIGRELGSLAAALGGLDAVTCSRPTSVSTRWRCAKRCAGRLPGSASTSTPRRTLRAVRASAPRRVRSRCG